MRWLPKPTPYRVLVISTTISLGTAKAYATAKDFSLTATSIEWITGVVVFSVFFVLDFFQDDPPRFLSWFMQSDLLADFFCLLSIPPLQYRTDELPYQAFGPMPPIFGYQILTSLTVASFGTFKAYLSYCQLSPASNAVDWVLGVFITSCLYILGLYEKNPSNYMPYLFSTNYSSTLYQISLRITYLIGISLLSLFGFWWYQISQLPPWLPIFPPSLFNALMLFSTIGARLTFHFWLLLLGGLIINLFRLLLYPLWHSPFITRIVATLRRHIVWMEDRFNEIPLRTKEHFRDTFQLIGFILLSGGTFLVSGYLSIACISAFPSLWDIDPASFQILFLISMLYIFKCFSLLCLIAGTLCMFALVIASPVFLTMVLASIFHSGWRRELLRP